MGNKDFTPRYERTLAAKLRPVVSKLKQQNKSHQVKLPLMKSPMDLGREGEDHINIWDRANSLLGRALSTSSTLGFHHPMFLHFNTVEGFWTWVSSQERDDRLRILTGSELRELSKQCRRNHISNFQAILMEACWEKVKQHGDLKELVTNCDLPFDCYYVQNNLLRIRPGFALWLVAGFEEIRKALKENRAPSFEFLREKGEPGTAFYQELADEIFSKSKAEAAKAEEAKREEIVAEGPGALLSKVSETATIDGVVPVEGTDIKIDLGQERSDINGIYVAGKPIVFSETEAVKMISDVEEIHNALVPPVEENVDKEIPSTDDTN